jgi:hypothetical protein
MIKAIFMVGPLIKLGNNYLIVNVGFGQRLGAKSDCGVWVVALPLRGECNLQTRWNLSQDKTFHFSLFLTAALEPNAGFAYNGARFIYYRPEP